jgi:hypothetical protein
MAIMPCSWINTVPPLSGGPASVYNFAYIWTQMARWSIAGYQSQCKPQKAWEAGRSRTWVWLAAPLGSWSSNSWLRFWAGPWWRNLLLLDLRSILCLVLYRRHRGPPSVISDLHHKFHIYLWAKAWTFSGKYGFRLTDVPSEVFAPHIFTFTRKLSLVSTLFLLRSAAQVELGGLDVYRQCLMY